MILNTKKRVLVVDDEPGILRFVKVNLILAGYDVVTTTNGEDALKLLESEQPDIMLLDILMAPMSGFDVLSRLRAFSQIPIVVFTGRGDVASKALSAGANDFIGKPFKPEDLTEKVKTILEKPLQSPLTVEKESSLG